MAEVKDISVTCTVDGELCCVQLKKDEPEMIIGLLRRLHGGAIKVYKLDANKFHLERLKGEDFADISRDNS